MIYQATCFNSIADDAVTKEDEAVIHMCKMGFVHIQCELKFALKELAADLTNCFGMLASTLDHNHEVIGAPTIGPSLFRCMFTRYAGNLSFLAA